MHNVSAILLSHRFSFLVTVMILMTASLTQAQNRATPLPFDVTAVQMSDNNREAQREAIDMLVDEFESRGAVRNEKEGYLFLIGISEPDEHGKVALSVAMLHRLPEQIVQIGRREQAFYRKVSGELKDNLPEEGQSIREYMSEEFMRQFVMIQGNFVEIVEEENLRQGISEIVDDIYEDVHLRR